MKTVVALFDHLREAKRAVRDLIEHGIAKDRISLVSPAGSSRGRSTRLHLEDEPHHGGPPRVSPPLEVEPESVGTAVGLGSMILGIAFLTVPAVGPVLAAGPLLAGIAAGGAGAGTEDLTPRLGQAGVPLAHAERYALAIRQGGALVVLAASEDEVDGVAQVLARHAPVDPVSRRAPATDAEEPRL
jgi:hypothetical protein